jgi:phosphoenolpyruvate synthase/pyruvate phosphate dikinase
MPTLTSYKGQKCSSATAEDLPEASFAGQQRTFLNVQGEEELVTAVQGCWASLFEPRAIFYREHQGFDHFKVGIAVPVQKMVQSQASGVMFTLEPVTSDRSKIIIEAVFGLGESIVGGKGANLGEMTRANIPVPPGFIITAHAYFDFLQRAKIKANKKYLMTT